MGSGGNVEEKKKSPWEVTGKGEGKLHQGNKEHQKKGITQQEEEKGSLEEQGNTSLLERGKTGGKENTRERLLGGRKRRESLRKRGKKKPPHAKGCRCGKKVTRRKKGRRLRMLFLGGGGPVEGKGGGRKELGLVLQNRKHYPGVANAHGGPTGVGERGQLEKPLKGGKKRRQPRREERCNKAPPLCKLRGEKEKGLLLLERGGSQIPLLGGKNLTILGGGEGGGSVNFCY